MSRISDFIAESKELELDRSDSTERLERTEPDGEAEPAADRQVRLVRHYNPETDRWTSQAPLGFDAGEGNQIHYVELCEEQLGPEPMMAPSLPFESEGIEGVDWLVSTYDSEGKLVSRSTIADREETPDWSGRYQWTPRELEAEAGLQYNRVSCCGETASGVWLGEDGDIVDAAKEAKRLGLP